jgi:Acyl-CoA thioesterase C-terminal domain/Acyl-CoA thioesterase N-terminal domain
VPHKDRAYFRREGESFTGNDAARGPWSADACHAGPVTGLLARALEKLVTDKQLVRMSLGFDRPIPLGGFAIDAAIEKEGRAATTATATLRDPTGRVCASVTSLHLAVNSFAKFPTVTVPNPNFADATTGMFPVQKALHGLPFFGNSIEVAYPPGESGAPGPTTIWMRTLPIVEGEVPSPFQRLCPIADCGNAIGRNAEFSQASFINADLTINVYRLPESEWLASQVMSFWEPTGIGMSHATLFDTEGAIGVALQTLIVRPPA